MAVTRVQALSGFRFADQGPDPELPAYQGAVTAHPTRPGVDEIIAAIDTAAEGRYAGRGTIVRGYGSDLAPSLAAGEITIASGAFTLDGRLFRNSSAWSPVEATSDGTYLLCITNWTTPALTSYNEATWTTLAAVAPAVLLCRYVVSGGVVTSLSDLRVAGAPLLGADVEPLAAAIAGRFGGSCILAGGATVVGDLTAGTHYPAVTLCHLRASGIAAFAVTKAASTITFLATSGTLGLYAVIDPAGATGPLAGGGWACVQFVAAATAPADGLLLGTGSVTGSAFTSYTPTAGLRLEDWARRAASPTNGHVSGVDGDGDPTDGGFALTDIARLSAANVFAALSDFVLGLRLKDGGTHYATLTAATQAANRSYTVPDAGADASFVLTKGAQTLEGDTTLTGAVTVTTGKLLVAEAAKIGPPTSGTYSTGATYFDLMGSRWYCTSGGTPGTWIQRTPGVVGVSPTAADAWTAFTTASNWNGGALLDKYWVRETATGDEWRYSSSSPTAKWVGTVAPLPLLSWIALPLAISATNTSGPFATMLDMSWDWYIESATLYAAISGSNSGSDYWDIALARDGGSVMQTQASKTGTAPWSLTSLSNNLVSTSTQRAVLINVTKYGSAGNITALNCSVMARRVRK